MTGRKILAQDILSGRWLDMDLPLTRDAEQPKWELSGAGSLTGVIQGTHPWLVDNDAATVLREWATYLYVTDDAGLEIVWGGILQESFFNGADWQLEAYGVSSYPNELPYTGGYQKLVDKDPGVVWAKLWQHVQSQPDGDLGVKFTMPDQLGPKIGTKDEPYELSWWEAKDVGSELSALASESPFDFVESHTWLVPTEVGNRPAIRIGSGNLHGAKKDKDRDHWVRDHLDDQVDLIGTLGADVFIAQELNDDVLPGMPDGAHRYFAQRCRERLSPYWQLGARDNGGNQSLYRSDVVSLTATTVREGIDDPSLGGSENMRSATVWTFRSLATGGIVRVGGYHLHSDATNGDSRRGSRLAEAADVDQLVGANSDVIACGDWNSYSMGSDEVYGIIERETGLVPMNKRTQPLNRQMNSYGKKKQGRWIDNQLSNPNYWDISDAAGVPTHGVTDHKLWMVATYTPRGQAAAGQDVAVADLSKKVRHAIELSYPRAGSRRADLRFVQGENVLEVVTPRRTGEGFANTVVTLGKGEGAKTLRGEDGVRDGRLRRVAIYTDKLAGSKDRCKALAKRERGYRGLGLRVESVLVDGAHPHAPMGSWSLGDDVLIEATVPHLGRIADWYRIMSWALVTDSTARLTLERADAFTYGPVVPPPADDFPELEVERDD